MRTADICLILEGTYPYVEGGVSTWTHELIARHAGQSFHVLSILPRDGEVVRKYELPKNVVAHTNLRLQRFPSHGVRNTRDLSGLMEPLSRITTGTAGLGDLNRVMKALGQFSARPGEQELLDSEEAWALMEAMYEAQFPECSFLDYFWSWRAIMGGMYSVLLADLPEAKAYHALSTGYAGILAARAHLETGRPAILTEHGIYTNERRIEVASADWLEEDFSRSLTIDETRRSLRDLWMDTFTNYSRIAYEASSRIITLFEGNQKAQIADGADPEKMQIIPNGVDVERLAAIRRAPHERPTVALIGRVVPIKDVKGFIRSCVILREYLPDLRAYVMGGTDEDEHYARECREMVEHFSLGQCVAFTGQVSISDYLPEIDVIVLTSISEAQPLVILEAGAAGIPCVATDVGACSELILGRSDEEPALGAGGAVVPWSNPAATADAIYALLTDREHYARCATATQARVKTYYTKEQQHAAYQDVYDACIGGVGNSRGKERAAG
jgi:glycosyltransferase involved in cell wall biosynthesis